MKSKSLNSLFTATSSQALRASLVLFISALSANAATFTWVGGGGDAKTSTPANWDAPYAANGDAIFNAAGVSGTAVDWDSGNIFSMTFGAAAPAYTFTSAGGMQFNQANAGTIVNNSAFVQTFSSTVRVFFNGSKTFNAGALAGGGLSLTTVNFRGDSMTSGQTNTLTLSGTNNGSVSGVISNVSIPSGASSALTKTGTGTWTLSGASTFTGAVTVSAGTLKAGVASVADVNGAFGLNPAMTVANVAGATLDLNGFNTQLGSLAGGGSTGGNVNLGSAVLTTGASNTNTSSGAVIAGTGGSLRKIGTGVQTLTAANTYSGGTSIDGGSLTFSLTTSKPATGTVTVAAGATVGLGIVSATPFSTTDVDNLFAGTPSGNTAGISLAATSSVGIDTTGVVSNTYASNIPASTLGLTKLGNNNLTLTGTNLHTGPTRISQGNLQVGTSANLGNANPLILDGGDLGIDGTALTSYSGGFIDTHAVTITPNKVFSILINDATNVFTASTDLTQGSGGMTKSGGGTLVLSGANTYTGTTTVLNGTLSVGSLNSVTTPTPVASSNLGVPTGTGSIGLGSGGATGNLQYTGSGETTDRVINLNGTTGGAGLEQAGTGVLKFTSNLTASGVGAKTLTLRGSTAGTGELGGRIINSNGTTTTSAASPQGATTLTLTSVTNVAIGASVSGTGVPANCTITAIAGSVVTITPAIAAVAGVLSGATITLPNQATNLTKTGTGTWTLGGANTYTGTTIVQGGELIISGLPTNIGTTTVQTGTLTLSGNRVATSGGINLNGLTAGTPTLNIQNGSFALTASFVIGQSSNTAVVNHTAGTITASAGNQVLLGNGTCTATYNLSGGSLIAAGSGIRMGVNESTTINSNTFNLSGTGSLNASLQIGRSDNSPTTAPNTDNVFNQTAGTATVTNLAMGGITGQAALVRTISAALNLTGGTFTATNFNSLSASGSNTSTILIGGMATVTLPAFPTGRAVSPVALGTDSTATVTFDGGTLIPAAADATYMSGLTNAYLTANGAKIDVPITKDITIAQVLENVPSAVGTLTKSGVGTLTLTGANSYTGNTTVVDGTLSINSTYLADTSTLTIGTVAASPAILNLPNAGTDTVAALVIDGVVQSSGLYDSANSSGAITGVGKIQVGAAANTYANWLTANSPATGFSTDTDNDGVPNGVENVLGTNPNTSSAGLTQVSATASSVTFQHTLNPTIASDVSYSYQWSSDLSEWKASGVANTAGTIGTVVPSAPAAGVVTVVTTRTGTASSKLFTRIKAGNP